MEVRSASRRGPARAPVWGLVLVSVSAIVLVTSPLPVRAQSSTTVTGTVTGTVTDESGLRLPGASVTLARTDGTLLGTAQTRRDGTFAVPGIPLGRIQVTVQLTGFRTVSHTLDASLAEPPPLEIVLPLAGFVDQVSITASRSERTLASVAASISVEAGAVIEKARAVNLVEVLRFVPGVTAGDVSGVDDLRISIRGAGIRAGFGSRGVLLMTDGYPVTEPDGQTPHFDGQIDLSGAERVEVVKGPASAVYGGAALGGVVNVISRVPAREPSATLRGEAGSYAFGKAHGAASSGAGPFVLSGTLGFTHIDGFRQHNSLRNWAATARVDRTVPASRLTFSFLGTDARLELPGTLNRAQFEQDPTQVRPMYVANDWGRDNRVFRFGGRFQRDFGGSQSIELDSYGQLRDLFHPIFVVIDQQAARYVGHGRYRLARGHHTFIAGVDADTQWVDDRWFLNAGGRPGLQIRDDEDTMTSIGVYVQDEIVFGQRANVTLGVRADRLTYDLVDVLTGGAASDRVSFGRISPKLGVTYAARADVALYANLATGFEAPTLGEVRLPAGFNGEVRPQKALSGEAGARGSRGRLSYDVALYRMVVDDEILPVTVDNVTVYRNVARAGHTGLELSTRLQTASWLTLEGTYAYSRFTLDDFGGFSGNRLPGVPPHAGTVRASLAGAGAWDAAVSLVAASGAFVSDANTERADAYAVLSGTIGYRIGRFRFFARGENLGDVRYTNRVQVNDASGFFYYPAPGRNGSVGVEARW